MPYTVEFKSKKPIKGHEEFCCWCYVIRAQHEDKEEYEYDAEKAASGDGPFSWGLDFSSDIDIQDPAEHPDWGCNDYYLGTSEIPEKDRESKIKDDKDKFRTVGRKPKGKKWIPNHAWPEGLSQLEICFIAPCEENEKTEVSLERGFLRHFTAPDGHEGMGLNQWEKVAFEGPKKMRGPAT